MPGTDGSGAVLAVVTRHAATGLRMARGRVMALGARTPRHERVPVQGLAVLHPAGASARVARATDGPSLAALADGLLDQHRMRWQPFAHAFEAADGVDRQPVFEVNQHLRP